VPLVNPVITTGEVVSFELIHGRVLFIKYSMSVISDPPFDPRVKFKIKCVSVGVNDTNVGALGATAIGVPESVFDDGLGPTAFIALTAT